MSEKFHNPDDPGYEKSDVNLLKVVIYGAVGVIAVVIILIFLLDYFTAVKEEVVYNKILQPESVALRELQAKETEILNNYALLDSSTGAYRIPVDRAMELIADEAYRDSLESARESQQ